MSSYYSVKSCLFIWVSTASFSYGSLLLVTAATMSYHFSGIWKKACGGGCGWPLCMKLMLLLGW